MHSNKPTRNELERSVKTNTALSAVNQQCFRVNTPEERIRARETLDYLRTRAERTVSAPKYLSRNIIAACRLCGRKYQKIPKYEYIEGWKCECKTGTHICGLGPFRCTGCGYVASEVILKFTADVRPYELSPHYTRESFRCGACQRKYKPFGLFGCLCSAKAERGQDGTHPPLSRCRMCCEGQAVGPQEPTTETRETPLTGATTGRFLHDPLPARLERDQFRAQLEAITAIPQFAAQRVGVGAVGAGTVDFGQIDFAQLDRTYTTLVAPAVPDDYDEDEDDYDEDEIIEEEEI